MKNKNRMDLPVYLVLFGAVLSAAGAYWSSRNQAKESEQNSKLYKQLAEKSDEIANYAKKQEKASEDNSKLYRELAEKSDSIATKSQEVIDLQHKLESKADFQNQRTEEINRLSVELIQAQQELNKTQKETINFTSESLNYLTGGDSYCYIVLHGLWKSDDKITLNLHHRGKYPLSALRVTITDVSARQRQAGDNGSHYRNLAMTGSHRTTFPVGPLPSSPEPYELGTISFVPKTPGYYLVHFFAQNGVWDQTISVSYDQFGTQKVESKLKINGKEIVLN